MQPRDNTLLFQRITDQELLVPSHESMHKHYVAWHAALIILFSTELRALAELLGAYGVKHLGEKIMTQIGSQIGELKVSMLDFRHVAFIHPRGAPCWVALITVR